jgi:polyhydroxybutyrate depolymerase
MTARRFVGFPLLVLAAATLSFPSLALSCKSAEGVGEPKSTSAVVKAERCDTTPRAGDDDCTAPLKAGSQRTCRFTFDGVERSFLLYAPPSYKPCAPTALVVDAHGRTETAEEQAGLAPFRKWPTGIGSGWRLVADREGFVVATPQGIDNAWDPKDVDFILEVEKKMHKVATIDPKRVYLSGISNGGFLSYWTGCRGTDVFKGFAPVSGATAMKDKEASCAAKPAPLIAFHAVGDSLVPFEGGKKGAEMWAAVNHCKGEPKTTMTFGGPAGDPRAVCLESGPNATPPFKLAKCTETAPVTTCQSWTNCDRGAPVVFCSVPGDNQPVGGHVLYFNDTRLSLAAVAWDFFKAQL